MADDLRCKCGHAWTTHMRKIPPGHAQRLGIRVLTKANHVWCVLCEKWHSTKDAPKDLV